MMEKKIRSSAEKITMPDELRERILDKCAEMEKSERSGNGTYTDHVFTVERAQPHRIRRVVSGLAACAVLAGGLGATGVFLHRQGSGNIASEVAQEACYVLCPFGDFTQRDYVFSVADENDEVHEYENNAELADLLNKFNWVEETEPFAAEEDPEVYMVTWQDEENHYHLIISSDGIAEWKAYPNSFSREAGHEDEPIEPVFTRYYRIDFNEFDSRVREILSADNAKVPAEETSEYAEKSIADEMAEKMTLAVYDENYSAVLTTCGDIVSDEGRQHDLDVQRQDMTNAMRYGLASWIYANSETNEDSRSGKVLFEVSVNKDDKGIAAFTFFEEGFYTYTVTNEDGTEDTYFFNGDCNEALEILRSAMDTEKKHTEDNAAYYLPGFNFEKLGIGGDMYSKQLQEIFYGYDWAAHEVTAFDLDSLVFVYGFEGDIADQNEMYTRHVDVYVNGYIHMYDLNEKNEKIHPEQEKFYKFNNNDILEAIDELYGNDIAEERQKRDELIAVKEAELIAKER